MGSLVVSVPRTPAPLRFVAANLAGPTSAGGLNVTTGATTRQIARLYFSIGSGDVSQIILSFSSFYISAGVGVVSCSGYTIESCSIEANGISVPVTFSGSRTKIISAGATDVQSDPVSATFAWGSTACVRLMRTFANPTTDVSVNNGTTVVAGNNAYDYDPAKVTITNGVDGAGPITYTMTGGGVDGTDIKSNAFPMMPAVLGRFVSFNSPSWVIAGDSTAYGTGGAISAQGGRGLSFAFSPDISLPAGAIASWNLGCNSGIAADWANGVPSLLTPYLKYFKYALEEYGTNNLTASASTAIHATLRASGIKGIIRTSLHPRASSSDSFVSEAGQTIAPSWGVGSAADLFEQAMAALVAPDLVYVNYHTQLAEADNYWLWLTNGSTPFYSTADGLHPSTLGYTLKATGTSTIIKTSGTTTGTLSGLINSFG